MHTLVQIGEHPAASALGRMLTGRRSTTTGEVGTTNGIFTTLPFSRYAKWWGNLSPESKSIITSLLARAATELLPAALAVDEYKQEQLLEETHLGNVWTTGVTAYDTNEFLGKLSQSLTGIGGSLLGTGIGAGYGALFLGAGAGLGAVAGRKSKGKGGPKTASASHTSSETSVSSSPANDAPSDLLFDWPWKKKKKAAPIDMSSSFDPNDPSTWSAFFGPGEMRTVQKVIQLAQTMAPGSDGVDVPSSPEEANQLIGESASAPGYITPNYMAPGISTLGQYLPGQQLSAYQVGYGYTPYSIAPVQGGPSLTSVTQLQRDSATLLLPRKCRNKQFSGNGAMINYDNYAITTGQPTIADLLTDLMFNTTEQIKPCGCQHDIGNLFADSDHCDLCDGLGDRYPLESPFYTSTWFRASFAELPGSMYGVTNLSQRPFEIAINPNAPLPRAAVSFTHETLHALDYMLKLGLTHEQLHDLAMMLYGEVLPGVMAITEAYNKRQ